MTGKTSAGPDQGTGAQKNAVQSNVSDTGETHTHEFGPGAVPDQIGGMTCLTCGEWVHRSLALSEVREERPVSLVPVAEMSGVGDVESDEGDAGPAGAGLLAHVRTGAWLDAQEFPPLAFVVPDLIVEGLTLLVGAPKIGKSWLVLALALATSRGGVAFGKIKVEQRPTLYLALEDGDRRMQDRCRQLLGGETIPEAFEYLTSVRPSLVVDTITAWLDRHGSEQPLVILDTLGKAMPPGRHGETQYQRDYRVGGELKNAVDAHPGASLIVNHHDRKAHADDFVDSVSGTHGLAGSADSILVLSRSRHGGDGNLAVTGRDVQEREVALSLTDGIRWELDGDDLSAASQNAAGRRLTSGLADDSARMVMEVQKNPDGVTPTEVGVAMGIDSKRAGTYLARLAEAGKVRREGRGRYFPVG